MTELSIESRLLVLAPTGRDAPLTCELLRKADLDAAPCRDLDTLCAEIVRGCAGVLVAEEVLRPSNTLRLLSLLSAQPAWSDLPFIVFMGEGATNPGLTRLVRTLGNVTVLDRPVRPVAMISLARSALRARRRQYEARAVLEARELAVERRDQFLAMLGHEIRNPLAAIQLAVDAVVPGEPASPRHVAIIGRQSAMLGRIVDDLLDVARVTSGKVQLRCALLDLGRLTTAAVQTAQPGAQLSGLELEEHCEHSLMISGDAVRLEQVVSNILANAIKYTPRGGHVRVEARRDGERAVLTVRDDGTGMSPETIARVFELFAQADGTLDRSQGGLGIGLTVAHTLVELHGGLIEAHSSGVGRGSTITVSLPLALPALVAVETPVFVSESRSNKHRVLLVEDSEDIRELMTLLITSAGHEVIAAPDGETGLRIAIEQAPDVALVDLGLPGIDGYDVARRCRERLGSEPLLIALSGYGQAEDTLKTRAAGFDLHLVKPVDLSRLRILLAHERSALRAAVEAEARRAPADQ